jgi:hypothetical protein
VKRSAAQVLLLKELRAAIGDEKDIILTLPADASSVVAMLAGVEPFVDHFTVKASGYSTSASEPLPAAPHFTIRA